MNRVAGVLGLCALALLTACSGKKAFHSDEAPAVLQARLIAPAPQANAFPSALHAAGANYWLESAGNPLSWRFAMNGAGYCVFRAELAPEGSGARVLTWSEALPDAANASVAAGRERADYSYLCDVARIAGEETVAAVVQNRAANQGAITAKLRGKLMTDPAGAMNAASAAMDEAAPEPYDPCEEDVASKRCEDWRTLQRVREEQRQQDAAAAPSGSFQMR